MPAIEVLLIDGTKWLAELLHESPQRLIFETILVLIALYVIFAKRYVQKNKDEKLTAEEVDQLVADWQPQPLVTPSPNFQGNVLDQPTPVISSSSGPFITVNDKQCINLATTNFLGLAGHPKIQEAAIGSINKYGVGSCGPRGFYGTLDVHLELEAKIAEFMHTENSIIFSSGYSTMASAIPTFSGRGDLLIVDKACCHAIKTGLELSRSDIKWYEHNDMDHLEQILEGLRKEDIATKHKINRRWIITEGVFVNTGNIVKLPRMLELKEKYCVRIMLDDSYGIGVLGKTGRGTCEHFGVQTSAIEIVSSDLGHSLGSVGGFCASNYAITFHMRINSSGYVFSASSPPYLVVAAATAIELVASNPALVEKLANKVKLMRAALAGIKGLVVCGDVASPVIHLRLAKSRGARLSDDSVLQEIVNKAEDKGVALTRAKYHPDEKYLAEPSIRVTVSSEHDDKELDAAAATLNSVVSAVLNTKN